MIKPKTREEIELMRESALVVSKTLGMLAKEVKPGVTTQIIDDFVFDMATKNGAYPSPLNYRGFPKSVCTSVNNCACHGIPDSRALIDGDIINVDVTVYLVSFFFILSYSYKIIYENLTA